MEYSRIKPWQNVINGVASEYHRKFDMCDLDDIRQELYGWFLTHPNKLDTWEAIGPKDAKNLIYRSLRNEALDYCNKWKAKSLGYEVDDLFYYTPEMIENLLPVVLRGDLSVLPVMKLDRVSGSSAPAESGNLTTMIAEVQEGYEKLNEEDKKILFMRFGLSFDFAEIQEQMGLNTDSATRMRLRRAIKHLIIKAGGYRAKIEEDDISPAERQVTTEEIP